MNDSKRKICTDKEDFLRSISTVAVVGAGRSGVASALLASSLGKQVCLTEQKNDVDRGVISKLKDAGVRLQIGEHSSEFFNDADVVVISPGVNTQGFLRQYIKSPDMLCVGEIEFAWWACTSRNLVAITGTNGKTTTSYLVGNILKQYTGRKVHILGNIGTPFSEYAGFIAKDDIVVLEISSFQLETIIGFKPYIGCLLNISDDHLDRYCDMEEYFQAKKNIFVNQTESDYAVFTSSLSAKLSDIKSQKIALSDSDGLSFIKKIAEIYGIDTAKVDSYINGFKGLAHRFEYVAEKNGVHFINDSKATNVSATVFALNKVKGPVLLIAGGKDKGLDYSLVSSSLGKVKKLLLIGQARGKIAEALKGKVSVTQASSLEEAVAFAFRDAQSGDTVLLSPMCSSFDQFNNFEERGDVFRAAVHKL